MIRMKMLSPEVYVADEPIVNLGSEEIKFLKSRVHENERKRIRLCAHKNTNDKIQEMFVIYSKETYVRPNKHLDGKDESLHILEGSADFIFLDDQGEIIQSLPLGDYSSGRRIYCRIPESVYHTFLIHSDFIVIHETIPGPFKKEDTVFASWSPEEGNFSAIKEFMQKIEKAISSGKNQVVR